MFKHFRAATKQEGQSLVEMAVIVPFLAILIIGAIEMSQAFTTYIALINAARAGATYASLYPETRNCANPPEDTNTGATYYDKCIEYSERVKDEFIAIGLDPDRAYLTIQAPVMYSPDGTTVYANCPITSTVTYNLNTIFTSSMSLPLVGRMGLPSAYIIRYAMGVPIRQAQTEACLPS